MHPAARDFVTTHRRPGSVLEFGSRYVNGGVRDLFGEPYTGLDLEDGPGVDVVADAATYLHPTPVDVVVCCEVLEHTPAWREIIANAAANLVDGGLFILTAATDPRHSHSAIDGGQVHPGEYYGNIDPHDLTVVLKEHFTEGHVDVLGEDVRAVAVK